MYTRSKAEIIINKVDNGFILKWEQERPEGSADYNGPQGFEVIPSVDVLLDRCEEILK